MIDKNRDVILLTDKHFIGDPCRTCGSLVRYKIRRRCVLCTDAYRRKYYQKNRDTWREYARQYDATHKEQKAKRWRDYYTANKERVAAYKRKWATRARSKECARASYRKWAKANPEKTRAARHLRRARLANAKGDFTAAEFLALCEHYDNKCLCCGEIKKLTVDHVIPLSKGGDNDIHNIQPLCKSCNSKKHTKSTDYRK